MLSVDKVRRARVGYFLASLPEEERQAGLVEEPGQWLGAGARRLGLLGEEVAPEALRALLDGLDPRSRSPLDPSHGRVRIVAFDCTFSSPKSVSLLERLAPPRLAEKAVEAQRAAVQATLDYLERQAASVRRSVGGERRNEPAKGLIAAAFLHRASRAPDPHLHTHLLVANLGQDPSGRWSALDSRLLYSQLAVAGALYEAELRWRLSSELGVCWQRAGSNHYELAGIPAPVIRAFSRRSTEIAAELAASGFSSPKSARIAALATRAPKDRSVSLEELDSSWRTQAVRVGLTSSRWSRVAPERSLGRGRPAELLEGLEAPFDRSTLLERAATRSSRGAPVEQLEARVDELLADRRLVSELAPAPSLLGRGEARFPAGAARRRYTTEAIEQLQARLGALLETAVELEIDGPSGAVFPGSGLVVFEEPPSGPESAAMLASLASGAEAARASGRTLRLLAVDDSLAARLQGSLGRRCSALRYPLSPGRGGVTFVAGPEALSLRTLCSLSEGPAAGRGTLVLVLARRSRTPGEGRPLVPLRDALRRLPARSRDVKGRDLDQQDRPVRRSSPVAERWLGR